MKKGTRVNFKPYNRNILVEAPVISKITEAGILKPDSIIKEEKEKRDLFLKVVAVADDVPDIHPGDKIMVGSGKLQIVPVDGIEYALVHVLSVIGLKRT